MRSNDVLDERVGVGLEAGDDAAVGEVQTDDLLVALAVDRAEVSADEDRRAVRAGCELLDLGVEERHEVRVDHSGVHVEREEEVAGEDRGEAGRRTWVNVPPTMTLLPIWRIALTCPSRMSGVQSAGSGFTTTDSGVWTAPPGSG